MLVWQVHERDKQRKYQEEYSKRKGVPSSPLFFNPPGAAVKPFYVLLNVEPGASLSQIQMAFRAKAFEHHPDLKRSSSEQAEANAKFAHILEAYQTLRDPSKRADYDNGVARI